MAFASTKTGQNVSGAHRVVMGSFSQTSGDTGGVIETGLRIVKNFQMTAATNVSINGGTITVTTADPGGAQAGFWMAEGV